jgi:uncharacterized protein YjiS (DUF1127 family)
MRTLPEYRGPVTLGRVILAPSQSASRPRTELTEVLPLRDPLEAVALRTLATNGFGDAAITRTAQYGFLASAQQYQAARTAQSRWIGARVATLAQALRARVQRAYASWRRGRHARAVFDALNALDTRTLRDLGFDRSEILSVAAEVAGATAPTRVHAAPSRRALRI